MTEPHSRASLRLVTNQPPPLVGHNVVTSDVALTRDGFHVDAPLTVGLVPLLSLLLWLGAAGACAYFLMKRPPASNTGWPVRRK